MGFTNIISFIALFFLMFLVKAHYAGMRLLIIAVAGLAGLYLIHILARDYQKIQAQRPKFLPSFLFKRSISEDTYTMPNLDSQLATVQQQLEKDSVLFNNQIEPLDVALSLDPMGCAQWYICDLGTRPVSSLTTLQKSVLEMIRNAANRKNPNKGAAAFYAALHVGKTSKSSTACNHKYSSCSYSITEMLKFIQPVY